MSKRVALCGGNGGLGRYIADAIITGTEWQLVILSRFARPDLVINGTVVKVRQVDYSSIQSIARVLAKYRINTVISTMPDDGAQLNVIDACLEAGVQRFMPSEFEGSPYKRPMITENGRQKLNVLRRLEELRDYRYLESTSITCGIFMEYFCPGGWQACGSGGWNDGRFLLDFERKTAVLPTTDQGPDAPVCLTSVVDVAQFVAASLNLPSWPAELKCFGERINVGDMLHVAEFVRDRKFRVQLLSEDEMERHLERAIQTGDSKAEMELQTMLSIHHHEYDFSSRNLNSMFPGIPTIGFEDFLRSNWRPSNR